MKNKTRITLAWNALNALFQTGQQRFDILRTALEKSMPLQTRDGVIGVNLDYLDAMTTEAYSALVKSGDLRPMSENEITHHKKRLHAAFDAASEKVRLPAPPKIMLDRPQNTPSFLMIPPPRAPIDEQIMGDDDLMPRKDISLSGRIKDRAAWELLKSAIVLAGGHVDVIDEFNAKVCTREAYTRDRFFIIGNKAFIMDPAGHMSTYDEEMPPEALEEFYDEIKPVKKHLKSKGFDIVQVKNCWFEGGNIIVHEGKKTVFMGLEHDASDHSANLLEQALKLHLGDGWKIKKVSLPRNQENARDFFHLDLGMSPVLPNGDIVICPEVTDPQTYAEIKEIFGADKVIEISMNNARNKMATNFTVVGNTLILTMRNEMLQHALEKRGYKTIAPDALGIFSFAIADGGAHCLTNEMPRLNRQA